MNKIPCIAADDEPHALNLIKGYVENTPYLELVATCTHAKEVLKIMNERPVNLLFLDIQMPQLTGMALAKNLEGNTKIIFTTAFDNYAIEGYKVNAVGYLLKPFSYEEFLEATQKAKKIIEQEQTVKEVQLSPDFIMIKADYKIWQIPLDDILYIEGIKDYVKIHRQSTDKALMPLMSLKTLEEKLPSNRFMRVQRSYIVNLDKISIIERNQIIFDKARITVSDNYKDQFNQFLQHRFRE